MTDINVTDQSDLVIESLAKITHQANKAFCEYVGDTSQVDWDQARSDIKAATVSGVKAIIANPAITPEVLHDNWMKDKEADGYVYGEVKDDEKKTHPCLVPYDQLPDHQRLKDHLFHAIVKTYIDFK